MISVLTPSYQYGRYLSDCIDSVASMHGGVDLEHLVLDNMSSDSTLDVLRQSSRSHLRWWREEDSGQSDALNRGLERSRGETIGWLNADEFYMPGTVDRVNALFREMPDVDVFYGDTAFVDERGHFMRLLTRIEFSAWLLAARGCYLSSCSLFFRRSALADLHFDTALRVVMDWDLLLGLVSNGAQFAYVPECWGAFRVHDQRVTATPISRSSSEHLRVRDRYNSLPGARASRPTRAFADVEFRRRKFLTGGWRRERQARRLVGADLVWMHGSDGAQETAHLLPASLFRLDRSKT